jgi:hypothetical protein
MPIYVSVCALLALLMAVPDCQGAETDVTSRTYASLRESVSGESIAPLYEYLDLSVSNMGRSGISFHASGWVRFDLAEESTPGDDLNQDLSYAYFRIPIRSLAVFMVGRTYVFEGVAAEQVDGAHVRVALPAGLGLALYGGSPVETDLDDRDGDLLYGARFSQGSYGTYEVGVSYLKEDNDGDDFREEAGVDIWYRPFDGLQVEGLSSYNAETSGWMEHAYSVALGPWDGLRVTGDYQSLEYEHFFHSPTTSAFDRAALDPQEDLVSVGGGVDFTFLGSSTAWAGVTHYDYDLSGEADRYRAGFDFELENYRAGISVGRTDGETDQLAYYDYRAYASKRFGRADVSVDLYDVSYDEEIAGKEHAYAASAALGVDIRDGLRVVADVEYAENPFFDEEVKGFFQLIYRLRTGGAS